MLRTASMRSACCAAMEDRSIFATNELVGAIINRPPAPPHGVQLVRLLGHPKTFPEGKVPTNVGGRGIAADFVDSRTNQDGE